MADIVTGSTSTKKRSTDATFDLNLAPFLDVIISVIPLLLLSIAFVDVKTIETPIPQVVSEAIENAKKKTEKEISINLKVSRKTGFDFVVTDKGKQTTTHVALTAGKFDYQSLVETTRKIKSVYPEIFNLQILPDKDVSFEEVVRTMDQIRRETTQGKKYAFVDPKSGKTIETDLMFPNVTFGNVVGE